MKKNEILKLTLAQFGQMQSSPISDNVLKSIDIFTRAPSSEDIESDALINPDEVIALAASLRRDASRLALPQRNELEEGFLNRILDDGTKRIHELRIKDVLKSWYLHQQEFAECEDVGWRCMQASAILPLLEGLKFLDYPAEEIAKLTSSVAFVREGVAKTQST